MSTSGESPELRPSLRAALAVSMILAACGGGGGDGDDAPADPDAATGEPDAAMATDAPPAVDAPPVESWATYRIEVGRHDATVTGGGDGNPVRGFTNVDARDFRFSFDSSAAYVLTNPVDPTDQLDWNKLPGLSDCGQLDLSVNGAMFGWRWRTDLTPRVLEVVAYANNNRTHLWTNQALFTLDAAELALEAPLRYRLWWEGATYHFTIKGMVGARMIDVSTTLTRACPNQAAGAFKWGAGLYFGGTSTAPSVITGKIIEIPFVP